MFTILWTNGCFPFPVISGQWKDEHEELFTINYCLGLETISPPAWFEPKTPWSKVWSPNHSAMQRLQTSSQKGNDRSPDDPICPKTLCSFTPTPIMLHIKFDQVWPTGFRDIQVQKCEIFVTQGQVTPKWVVWFVPKSNSTKLLCLSWLPATLMIIRSKMNELARRHHFPIISLWEIF